MVQALRERGRGSSSIELSPFKPQPGPQLAAFEATWCYELLYGGARGGGKSIYLLLDYLQDVPTYGEAWHGIIVRHTFKQLEQLIRDSHKIFPKTGAWFEKQPKTWHWQNGATLKFRNLETVDDTEDYQGHSYGFLGFDELGNYKDSEVYTRMLATCRSGDIPIPTARVRSTANPGGPGHHWIKQRFIEPAPIGYKAFKISDRDTRERMYLPSKVTDNKKLLENDPYYIENLKQQGNPELVKAWLEGDWNVQISAFFTEFKMDRHVLPQFKIPDHWYRFRSFDWGSARPFCSLWFAVADGSILEIAKGKRLQLTKGSIIAYREWYGMQENKPNVGIHMRNEDIAAGILRRSGGEQIAFTVTDSLPFQDRGGIKMAETFYRAGVPMKRGDDSRIPGWQQVRSRLQGTEAGPLIFFMDNCVHTIRTLPALQADKHNFEDVDSNLEDHAPDTVRLACMERPVVRKASLPARIKPLNEMTFDELLKEHELYGD